MIKLAHLLITVFCISTQVFGSANIVSAETDIGRQSTTQTKLKNIDNSQELIEKLRRYRIERILEERRNNGDPITPDSPSLDGAVSPGEIESRPSQDGSTTPDATISPDATTEPGTIFILNHDEDDEGR